MFSVLNSEASAEMPVPPRPSRSPSRTASVDLSHGIPLKSSQRPNLNLFPRTKPVQGRAEGSPATGDGEEPEEGEIHESEAAREPSLSKEQAEHKIDQDLKEFFAIRNLDEAEDYFTALPGDYHAQLVVKLVMQAIESKRADVQLVAYLFDCATSKTLCSARSHEEGFIRSAELLDDIAIDAPKAFDPMAIIK